MRDIVVATADGVHVLGRRGSALDGTDVTCLYISGDERWAVLAGREVVRLGARFEVRESLGVAGDELAVTCLAADQRGAYAGTEDARVFFAAPGTRLRRVEDFDETPGREEWYTPWGGPPDVRSIAATSGELLVNVHVGGILRRETRNDGVDAEWVQTIDIDADVHQVAAGTGPVAVAAAAVGLCVSMDGGRSWNVDSAGLHSTYARAVCIAADHVLVTVSDGPGGGRAAVYRRALAGPPELRRCEGGLPEWFDGNIDTFWLASSGPVVAFVTDGGDVWSSSDAGQSWEQVASSLPPARALALS